VSRAIRMRRECVQIYGRVGCIKQEEVNVMRNEKSLKTAASLNLLLGIWLFVSPWVYGVYRSQGSSYNSWVVGVLIAMLATARYVSPATTRGLSFMNMVLGAWTFASPWVYNYTPDTGRFINSLCVGAIVFIVAAYGSMGVGHPTAGHGAPPAVHS
jgi:SPW repeat